MSDRVEAPPQAARLTRNSIGMAHIVFFVVAAAAPMTAVVGATPPAFAFGNGAGVPGAFLLAGAVYLLFSVGFTAMARHVTGAGAFYSYITRGLGRPAGIGGALMALVTYFAIQIGIFGLLAVFMQAAVAPLGLALPWWVWSLAVLVAVVACGRRSIVLSGQILGLCMLAEIAILLLLDAGIVLRGGGPGGLTLAGFAPAQVFGPGLGLTLVFVVGAFVGFEATAIFGEEARAPERTIPRATYAAVAIIALFYAASTWAIVQFYGADQVAARAGASLDGFWFDAAAEVLGPWSVTVLNLLLLTSLFACLLSFHNTLNRYFYALAREGLAWTGLARVHGRHGSPHVAGLVQAALVALCLAGFALSDADPYTVIFSWMSALAVLGILALQVLVSIAVIVFFARDRRGRGAFATRIAPALSALALAGFFALVSDNLSLLTGSENPAVLAFPWAMLAVGLIGAGVALRLRRANPAAYDRLGAAFDETPA